MKPRYSLCIAIAAFVIGMFMVIVVYAREARATAEDPPRQLRGTLKVICDGDRPVGIAIEVEGPGRAVVDLRKVCAGATGPDLKGTV